MEFSVRVNVSLSSKSESLVTTTSTHARTLPAVKVMDGVGMVKSTPSIAEPPVTVSVTVTGNAAMEDSSPHT